MDVFSSFQCSPKERIRIAKDHVKESGPKFHFIYRGSNILFFFVRKKSILLWKTTMVVKLLRLQVANFMMFYVKDSHR